MPTLSLADRLELLEGHLRAHPPEIQIHADVPIALFRYDPEDEWETRRQARLLAARLEGHGRHAVTVSLAELLWQAIAESEGIAAVEELERERGFQDAQRQVTTYLTSPRWHPLPGLLVRRLEGLDPDRHVAFLTRVAVLGPGIYPVSKLIEELKGRVRVPSVVFYPGTHDEGDGLRFLGLPGREASGSYRVKVY
jgi:hypothetical protein